MGDEMKNVQTLLPSISILIQEAAAKNSANERITYCYDQLISKVFHLLKCHKIYNLRQ